MKVRYMSHAKNAFFILKLLYERTTYQINGKGDYNFGLYLGPRFYDANWIQLVYELSHVVKDKVQVTHSDNDDNHYYYGCNNYDYYFDEYSGRVQLKCDGTR